MFKQRHLFTTRTYHLAAEGIDVGEHSPIVSRSYRVPFANIPALPARVSVASGRWLWATVILALLAAGTGIAVVLGANVERIAWLVWGTLAVIAGGAFAASRRKYVIFRAGEPGLVLFDGQRPPLLMPS
jgi:hypothetical protein